MTVDLDIEFCLAHVLDDLVQLTLCQGPAAEQLCLPLANSAMSDVEALCIYCLQDDNSTIAVDVSVIMGVVLRPDNTLCGLTKVLCG